MSLKDFYGTKKIKIKKKKILSQGEAALTLDQVPLVQVPLVGF